MSARADSPCRGITLLEAVLAAALLLGAGGFAAWRVTAPERVLRRLQSDLVSKDTRVQQEAAREIFRVFVREGMTPEQIERLFPSSTFTAIDLAIPVGFKEKDVLVLDSPHRVSLRDGNALIVEFVFADGALRRNECDAYLPDGERPVPWLDRLLDEREEPLRTQTVGTRSP